MPIVRLLRFGQPSRLAAITAGSTPRISRTGSSSARLTHTVGRDAACLILSNRQQRQTVVRSAGGDN
jgi:hypothetical protein